MASEQRTEGRIAPQKKAKIGKLQAEKSTAARKRGRPKTRVPYVGWARFYKVVAVIGVSAVALPYITILFSWGARKYAAPLSLLAVVAMVALGYAIQLLLLGRDRAILHTTWDFSFEPRPIRLPLWRVIPACLLSAVAAVMATKPVTQILTYLFRNEYDPGVIPNEEVGAPLIAIGFVILAVGGCLLVPVRPHVLLSMRTMVEFLAALLFPMAVSTFWGGGYGTSLMAMCFVVYLVCLAIIMNQEAVIRPAYGSSTCIATHAIRRAGLVSVIGYLLFSLLLTVPVLGTITVVVIFFRILIIGGNFVRVFQFPFDGLPGLNAALFVTALLCWVGLAIYFSMTRTPEERAALRAKIAALWERLVDRILHLLGIRDIYAAGQGRFEPVTRNYTDTVAVSAAKSEEPMTYRAFAKKLKSMNDIDERFCYAWRTMVAHLCAERRDITPAMTPLEMAHILAKTTTVQDIDRLTRVFLEVTYAEGHTVHATEADVHAVTAILAERW